MEHLEGTIRAYPWGSRTLIPSLRGEPVPAPTPEAELWYGAHPASPSVLADSGTPLDAAIAAAPEQLLGSRVLAQFGPELPFLLKLLAAEKPLSLQAHPSLEQAKEGFARENAQGVPLDVPNRNYKDANHKPELIVALGEFKAMCGFRPLERTVELLEVFACPALERYLAMLSLPETPQAPQAPATTATPTTGVPATPAAATPGGGNAASARSNAEDPNLRTLFTSLITVPRATREELISQVTTRAAELQERPDWIGEVAANVVLLHKLYPGDIGVVIALLLNHYTMQAGEAMYLDAGTLHAYIHGLGVEIMANSDNVLRGGLTSKFVDVAELVRVISFHPTADPRVPCTDGEYRVPVPDFRINRLELHGVDTSTLDNEGPNILMCTRGKALVYPQGGEPAQGTVLRAGQGVWVAADEPDMVVRAIDAAGQFSSSVQAQVFWARV